MGKAESIRRARRRAHPGHGRAKRSEAARAAAALTGTASFVSHVDPGALLELLTDGHPPAFATDGRDRVAVSVTILKIPGVRPDLFTVVHILEPIAEGRLTPLLTGLSRSESGPAPPLTRRETEILRQVAAGLQNKEVAQKLGLSLPTVRNHVHNILNKIGVHSKLEAVCLSFRNGWISADVPGTPLAHAQRR